MAKSRVSGSFTFWSHHLLDRPAPCIPSFTLYQTHNLAKINSLSQWLWQKNLEKVLIDPSRVMCSPLDQLMWPGRRTIMFSLLWLDEIRELPCNSHEMNFPQGRGAPLPRMEQKQQTSPKMPKDDFLGIQTLLTSECFNITISMQYTMPFIWYRYISQQRASNVLI